MLTKLKPLQKLHTRLIHAETQGEILTACLSWTSDNNRVHVRYFFPFLNIEPKPEDITHEMIVEIENYCIRMGLTLYSY